MDDLIDEVRHCRSCEGLGLPFVSADGPGGPSFRFPPTIGATAPVPLLFVGINPRISNSNRDFHKILMDDSNAFVELAGNRFRGERYVRSEGNERHYSPHIQIASKIYPHQPFEAVAAVTELFFCASVSATGLPIEHSPCADKYFERVLALVQPSVVFAVGRGVATYLIQRFGSRNQTTFATWGQANQAKVVAMPHPNSRGEKLSSWAKAADSAQSYLLSSKVSRTKCDQIVGLPFEPLASDARSWPRSVSSGAQMKNSAVPRVSYQSTRLHFKRAYIEPLEMQDEFEIITPDITWRMTKADFHHAFQNVLDSQCYSGSRGEYFYPKPPERAERFRVK